MNAGPLGALRSAWSLLTALGGGAPPHRHAATCYGVVGAVLGALLGGLWWALADVSTPLVVAVVIVALDAGFTGLLHLDGLADCGDGLLAPMERSRRLEVMRRPDVGAFGVCAVVLALLLRTAALAGLAAQPLLLVGLWALSRGAMAATVTVLPYARTGGLASAFADASANRWGAAIGLGLGAAALAAAGWTALVAGVAALVAAAAVAALARRRLGGYTGDVLGAVVVVAETAGLVAATVR